MSFLSLSTVSKSSIDGVHHVSLQSPLTESSLRNQFLSHSDNFLVKPNTLISTTSKYNLEICSNFSLSFLVFHVINVGYHHWNLHSNTSLYLVSWGSCIHWSGRKVLLVALLCLQWRHLTDGMNLRSFVPLLQLSIAHHMYGFANCFL